jgi:uncharacterized protein YcaQ
VKSPRAVTRAVARRFLRRVHFLDQPAPDIATVLAHHGFIQIDPINVSGRMQDHILRNRVLGYREGDLMRHLHPTGPRTAFEHHLPSTNNLSALPLDAWPHLQAGMRRRTRSPGAWGGRLTPREKEVAIRVMERLASGGPVAPEDFATEGRARRSVWNTATLAKSTLQKLFFHGRLLIVGREHNRRLYDLPERVLPAEVLRQAEHAPDDTAEWLAHLRLRQHRLVPLRRAEAALVGDVAVAVEVEGGGRVFLLKSDLPLLEQAVGEGTDERVLLLAPLDPMIYHRPFTRSLWDFDYTWEVYTPPQKRKRGYYALPVLAGTELVGHVDAKADREGGRLCVVGRKVRRGYATAGPVRELAGFLGLKSG